MNVHVVIFGEHHEHSTIAGIFISLQAARDFVTGKNSLGEVRCEGYEESDCPPNYWRRPGEYITIREYPLQN